MIKYLLLIPAFFIFAACGNAKVQESVQKKDVVKEVRVVKPEKKMLSVSVREGVTLSPEESGAVTSDISSTVKKWLVEEHQYVQKDQPVAQLDATDFELMLEQNKGQLAALEAQYAAVEKDVSRLKALLDAQSIPKQQYDSVEAQRLALQRQIESAKKGIGLIERKVEQATVRAPFTGVITKKKVSVGYRIIIAMSDSGDIAYIEKTDRLKASINISEAFFSEIDKGTEIEFYIPSINKTVLSKVYSKGRSISTMKKFSVIVYIENSKNEIPAGSFAFATIKSKPKEKIIVPPMSVKNLEDNVGEIFEVVSGKVTGRKVYIGFPYEEGIEIIGDVPALIVKDASGVIAGETVKVSEK